MSGWFELDRSTDGHFKFVLKSSNGEVILTSELYKAKPSALNGLASVRMNSPRDARYVKETAKDGRSYFNLKAGNSQIIGTSQMYSHDSSRDAGIAAVKANGMSRTIKDNT